MTDWTGIMYGFYTEKSIPDIFEAFKNEVNKMNYLYVLQENGEEKVLFCYKNNEMLDYHLENGFNTDLNSQGCFSVEAKNVNLHGIASLFEYEGRSDFEPYDINLALNNIYYYVLIVPDFIGRSDFSKHIHGIFNCILQKT